MDTLKLSKDELIDKQQLTRDKLRSSKNKQTPSNYKVKDTQETLKDAIKTSKETLIDEVKLLKNKQKPLNYKIKTSKETLKDKVKLSKKNPSNYKVKKSKETLKDEVKLSKETLNNEVKTSKESLNNKVKTSKESLNNEVKKSKESLNNEVKPSKENDKVKPSKENDKFKDKQEALRDEVKSSKDEVTLKSPKKYFLFKCGPTGSGKSQIENIIDIHLKKTKEIKDNIFKHKDTVNLSIDDLVERNPYFKESIDRVFNNIINKTKTKIKKEIKIEGIINDKTRKDKIKSMESIANERIIRILLEIFDNPNRDIIDELNMIYENARMKTSCINGIQGKVITRQAVKTIKDSCENIRDHLLQKALDQDKNIVFERTGKDFPKKLFDKFPKIAEYNIIFCWSVVNVCELLHRNKERVIVTLDKYLKIKDNSPLNYDSLDDFLQSKILPIPRLPDTNEQKYKKSLSDIINAFNIFFFKNKEYRQIIIDNNYEPLVIYDNKYNDSSEKGNPMLRYNIDQQCD